MDESNSESVVLDFSISESIEATTVLVPATSTHDCLVMITKDSDGSRNLSLAPVSERGADGEALVHIAYKGGVPSIGDQLLRVTSASRAGLGVIVLGYSTLLVRLRDDCKQGC